MPRITIDPGSVSVDVEENAALLTALRAADVSFDAPCGGQGTCGRCLVRIVSGTPAALDPSRQTGYPSADGWVLACRTTVGSAGLHVEIPAKHAAGAGAFAEESLHLDPALLPQPEDLHPPVRTVGLTVPPPELEDGLSDADRFATVCTQEAGTACTLSLSALRALPDALRVHEGTVLAVLDEHTPATVVTVSAASDAPFLGAAIDIGTTTVAVQLVSLHDGRVLSTATDYNGQMACGADVISRINYARKPEGREELRRRVLDSINTLLGRVCSEAGVEPVEVVCVSLSGNTTMVHLLLGLTPEYLRLDPYVPAVHSPAAFRAGEVGLAAAPAGPVLWSPAVGSYVGGDICAGLLCTPLVTGSDDMTLYLDLGTNGEVVLGNADFLMTCACSAGPAFEGGGIGCGMRAADGAIERVAIDSESGMPTVGTVGDAEPVGICGSGMISLVAELFRTGWLDGAGKLMRDRACDAITVDGRRARYVLARGKNRELCVDEQDIENLLRAKAAVYAACALMLENVGIGFGDIARVCVAGGFGRSMHVDDAITIGLLPDIDRSRFQYVGNASLTGARMALVSRRHRELLAATAARMTYLELNTCPDYMDQYTAALFVPHTEAARFPSVAAGDAAPRS